AGAARRGRRDWPAAGPGSGGFPGPGAPGTELGRVLAFSGLPAVLRPLMDGIDALDPGHAKALRGALGHEDGHAGLLAVHGATLALVAAAAEEAPVLVAVDDAQWVDQSSLESLVFAAHRCEADRVG